MAHAMMSSGVSYEAASAALNWTPAGSDVDYISSADETQPLQSLPRHEEIQATIDKNQRIIRVMRAVGVDHQLASAALNWTDGQEVTCQRVKGS